MDTVVCKHCSRNVVPRLWHEHSDLQHRITQHLCPLCGKIMYVTGGEPTFGAWMIFAIIACGLIYGLITTIVEKFSSPTPKPPVACKGSAAHCKAVIKQK